MKKEQKWSRRGERLNMPNVPCILPPGTKGPLLHGILLRAKLEEIQYQLANLEKETPNIVTHEKELQKENTISYNSSGYRNDNNRNQIRARDFLFKERKNLIGSIDSIFPAFRIPASLRIAYTKCTRKFYLSSPNMIGFIIGPRGESLRALENEFQVRISIRGQGSTLNAKHESSYPKNNDEEPLHALIEGDTEGKIDECVKKLEVLCKPVPDSENEIKKQQLRHLAMLNGVVSAESAFSEEFGKKSDKPPWYDDTLNFVKSSELDDVVKEVSMIAQDDKNINTEINEKSNEDYRFQRFLIDLTERDISALVPEPKIPGL
ncbi:KH domain containing protein [Histomonas meleagridis]|uniref:KH domain containing protein n=1 Tax=Histomonas meleagridis TaxID=135588 RepID=UPI00355A0CB8|nr:KH domain containing protein [Histomonas meleagridis]KAH0805071.1 KH domain containing protein [Histomonas meleagridis]